MASRISKLSAIRKASRWQRKGAKWHFHLLSPGCLFNPTKWHELVLESAGHGNYLVRSHRPLVEIARHLAQILHKGKSAKVQTSPGVSKVSILLKRAEHLNHKKVKWHHHLLFPHCTFNKQWGKWILAFEDPLNNRLTELVYQHFPESDLKKVEKLFYSQKR